MSRPGRFDPEMVQRIRWHAARGDSDRDLASALDCTPPNIYWIRTRRSYATVPDPLWSADWLLEEAQETDEPILAAEHDRRRSAQAARRSQCLLEMVTAGGPS